VVAQKLQERELNGKQLRDADLALAIKLQGEENTKFKKWEHINSVSIPGYTEVESVLQKTQDDKLLLVDKTVGEKNVVVNVIPVKDVPRDYLQPVHPSRPTPKPEAQKGPSEEWKYKFDLKFDFPTAQDKIRKDFASTKYKIAGIHPVLFRKLTDKFNDCWATYNNVCGKVIPVLCYFGCNADKLASILSEGFMTEKDEFGLPKEFTFAIKPQQALRQETGDDRILACAVLITESVCLKENGAALVVSQESSILPCFVVEFHS